MNVMQRTESLDFLIGHWWHVCPVSGVRCPVSDGIGPLEVLKVERHSSSLDDGLPGKASARYDETGKLEPILSTCSVTAARRFLCRQPRTEVLSESWIQER